MRVVNGVGSGTRARIGFSQAKRSKKARMSRILFAAVVGCLVLCAGCAGAPSSSSGSGGGITMYGTVDQGITVHN